jgi:hypothetical protein
VSEELWVGRPVSKKDDILRALSELADDSDLKQLISDFNGMTSEDCDFVDGVCVSHGWSKVASGRDCPYQRAREVLR